MSLTVLTVTGLAHWATYLVNDDCSGLEPSEIAAADAWFKAITEQHPVASSVFVVDCGETRDERFNGLLSDVVDYTLHVQTPEEHTLTVASSALQQALVALYLQAQRYDEARVKAYESLRGDMSEAERVATHKQVDMWRKRARECRDAALEIRVSLPMCKA